MSLEALQIEEEALGDGLVIAARGEIDHATSPLIADALRKATLEGEGQLVIDLTEVSFIDSAGISTMLNGLRRLTRLRRKMVVVCPPGPALRVFEVLGLVGTFELVGSRAEALAQA